MAVGADILSDETLELGLARILRDRLNLFNDGVAIEDGGHSITFRELHCKALKLMQTILQHQIRKEEPIGVLAPRGIDHIISQVAVIYAGGTCVPINVDLPDTHISNMLHNIESSILLSDISNCHRLGYFKRIVVNHAFDDRDTASGYHEVSENDPYCRSHIFHTSGSTGKPKAVQVLSLGLLNLVFNDVDLVRRGHRLGHVCNIGFDVSLWEIWSSLLHGATIVVYHRHELLDAMIFEQRLQNDRIDVLWQTTSLLATLANACPQIYSNVNTLVTGGEAVNIQTCRAIFANGPPRQLWNLYGPTELTVFATCHQITPEDVQSGTIPIGRPLRNYQAFIVDENLQPVPDGHAGELLVGGAGVTAGYFRNPAKTSSAYVSAPHLSVACKTSTGLLYRTGDFARSNHRGLIEYLGRQDSEVKIHGRRVDLASVEACLLKTTLVSAAVALKIDDGDLECGSELLAFVIPAVSDLDSRLVGDAYAKLAPPQLMVPRIELVDSLFLTPSGKTDRIRLAKEYIRQRQSMRLARNQNGAVVADNIENHLQGLWQDILGLSLDSIQTSDDFFLIGGTSLHAALLVSKLQQSLGVVVRVATLFENSTFESMCDVVSRARNDTPIHDYTAEMALWLKDCDLGSDIKAIAGSPADWQSDGEGRVFLTGATGFMGSFFLAKLLALPQVKTVVCLVRAENQANGILRIREALEKYQLSLLPGQEDKIVALLGDLSQADLGIGVEQYLHLAEWSSVVFHLGAHINYVQPYSNHRAANVLGTVNMIRFANTSRPKHLHYTSSISAYGPTGLVMGSTHLPEDERPANHVAALRYDTGYSQSQFVAETIAWKAIDNGLPLTIYRPGVVLGHSEMGTMNTDDFFHKVMASCIRNASFPLLPQQREDFVPVDFVVSAMLHIASKDTSVGQAYNLVHPTCTIDMATIFQSVNSLIEASPMRGIPYAEWVKRLSQSPNNLILSLLPMLEEKVFGDRTRWEMQQSMPEFGTANLCHSLADNPDLLLCPSPTSLIATYLPHWVQAAST
ncbi:putative NRPS-like enzyme [Aspergillus steynii IBT 23096]|uniref:Putative NRPS-like enzyme n=1 Tax=Aspergillus steynii IBT 23096 TaxID=1392250 RepID=A0A2I2FZP9_9EURO|nr:putative NRPS-like enzyme [Aspergillus steynii IBT 23096]PLB46112.1 putative NRPS-like enzyme [Aspergillus steynii IBT 23096]